jgi:hypothetical protein
MKKIILGLLLGVAGGGVALFLYASKTSSYSPLESYVIQESIIDLVERFPVLPEVRFLWVFPFRGDTDLTISSRFQEHLDRSGKVKILPKTEIEKVLEAQKLEPFAFSTSREARQLLKRFEVDGILIGDLLGFLRKKEETTLEIELRLLTKNEEKDQIWNSKKTLKRSFTDPLYLSLYLSSWSLGAKIGVFLLFVLGLPWISFWGLAWILKQDQNVLTAGTLVLFSVLDLAFFLLLSGGWPESGFGFLFLFLLAGVVSFYNYGSFTEIQDLS